MSVLKLLKNIFLAKSISGLAGFLSELVFGVGLGVLKSYTLLSTLKLLSFLLPVYILVGNPPLAGELEPDGRTVVLLLLEERPPRTNFSIIIPRTTATAICGGPH